MRPKRSGWHASIRRRWRHRCLPRAAHGLLEAIRSVLDKAQRSAGATATMALADSRCTIGKGWPCSRCGHRIRRIVQGGRSTYYCPHCQRR